MKKMITCLTMLSMVLASVPAAGLQAAAAAEETAVTAAAEQTEAPADITGCYFYQKLNETTGVYENAGYLTVSENGTYIYQDYAAKTTAEGTVKLDPKVYPDGTAVPWFSFIDKNGKAWFGCYGAADSNMLTNGGSQERLLRDNSSGTENQASEADLAGKWFMESRENKAGAETTYSELTVDENGRFFCIFNLTDGAAGEGTESVLGQVTLHFEGHPDGTETTVYRFITEDGTIFAEGTLADDNMSMVLASDGIATMKRDQTVRRASSAEITGSWVLKEMKNAYKPEEGYSDSGVITVNDNKTYTYRNASGKQSAGSVFASYELHPNGTVTIWYDFYDSNGTYWIGCQDHLDKMNRNTLYVGQTAEQMLVRETAVPNDYGYYDIAEMPVSGISMKALDGEWKNGDVTMYIFNSTEQEGLFEMFTDEEGMFSSGRIKIQYQLDQKGKEHFYYVLYSGENLYLEFDMTGELPLDTLTAKRDDTVKFVRGAEPYDADSYLLYDMAKAPGCLSARALEGAWEQNDTNAACVLTFSDLDDVSGKFRLVGSNEEGIADSVTEGIVKLQYNYDVYGERTYIYALYVPDETGECTQIWMTILAACDRPADTLQLSNMDISFRRSEAAQPHKYTNEQLIEMAKKDYQKSTGILPADAHSMENYGGTVTVVLTDTNGEDFDAYTVDPDTGIGERFSDKKAVNLPQTGNNSLKALLLAFSAFLLSGFGFFAVRKSGVLRRRNDVQ